jgi:hypothetical protein
MVVKIRFGRGPVVTQRKGKNSGIAMLSASMLTMVSICFASFGFWRLAEDVNLAGGFVYTEGFLSHWQVWLFAAGTTQYGAWRLTRYARLAGQNVMLEEAPLEPSAPTRATAKVRA